MLCPSRPMTETKSLGHCVPWTMRPWDDAAHGCCAYMGLEIVHDLLENSEVFESRLCSEPYLEDPAPVW
jgi:hypothetical protein